MNVALRGLTVLVGGTTIALSAVALANPATATPSKISVVHSCAQQVAKNHATCFALRRSDLGFTTKHQLNASPAATPSGYGPSSLQSAYSLASAAASNGAGERVYIVDAYDDPNAATDLNTYRSQFGLPSCTTSNGCFQKINQNGSTTSLPTGDTGWAGEESLDLDMVSAICPKCSITLVEANSASDANLFTAVREATTLGGKFVSMSWGGGEASSQTTYDGYMSSSGVVYTASTGDDAYTGASYPASSVNTVAVGGTSLSTASNSRGWSEKVWKTSSTEGTGSGCSAYEAKPSWQSIISSSTCSKRAESDVSAVADPATGVAVYQTYGGSGWAVYGGTSASAPIIASTYALAGVPSSSTKPASLPYAHTGNLNDVTSGNNGTCSPSLLCTAATGWDGPTGLGTPNGTTAFGGSGGGGGNTVTVTNPGNKTGTVGTATSLQISASDSGGASLSYSASGLPTGLSINASSGLISGTPSAAGTFSVTATATDTTGASGSASFTWTISGSGGGGSCSGQKLTNPGFESGSTGWTASSGVINTDGANSRTGSGYAWLDGYGTTHTDTLSQSVTIPSGCSATLTYYLYINTSETSSTAYDKLTVTANGTTVQSFSNANHGTGYVQRSVSLNAYAGQTVTIKWTGTEDSSLQTSFLIDDTALTLS
ncbi:MAG TPA: putative Ig domain-containing protein [Jatrophihabitantaceae bacterium]